MELQWQSRSYKSSTRGMKIKSSATRETWSFGEGPVAESFDFFLRKISNTCAKHINICNVGDGDWLVRNYELDKEPPDPASSQPHASTSEIDSDDFDYGALIDRND